MRVLVKVLLIAVVSLLAATLLHWLFEANEAAVAWGGDTVRLGGPVAAFTGVFLIIEWAHRRLIRLESEDARGAAAARVAELSPLTGRWTVDAKSNKSDRRARSETKFEAHSGRLHITGGTFRHPETGATLGDWSCEAVAFDGDRLIYLYSLMDQSDPTATQFWRGVVDARIVPNAPEPHLEGRWQVFGTEHHDGVISMRKAG